MRTWSKFVSPQCLGFPIWKMGITKVVQISCCDLGKALNVVSDRQQASVHERVAIINSHSGSLVSLLWV